MASIAEPLALRSGEMATELLPARLVFMISPLRASRCASLRKVPLLLAPASSMRRQISLKSGWPRFSSSATWVNQLKSAPISRPAMSTSRMLQGSKLTPSKAISGGRSVSRS